MRENVFGNNSGFRFHLSFVDWTSVFVKSVLEASLSFTYILLITTVTLHHVDKVLSVTGNVRSDGTCFTVE